MWSGWFVFEIFDKVAQGIEKKPEKVKEVDAVYLFRISGKEGGIFHVDLKNRPGVSREEKEADCVLDISDRDFLKLFKGTLQGHKALLTGKLKVKGSIELVAKLKRIFDNARS